ncbi:hypothetical protein F0562_026516 [Nyssa sinensis]|uniref:Retrotransposon gag domain-containing protein n=1 Tax=Nyssa sinensis TaxID=561372 RepID=A0A5J5BB02_9ASTE|nr:hypothetical protein F0562_026516 [Nyssa sinensis]
MADGTRSQDIRRIEDAIRHLKESSDKQAEAMAGIKDLVSALNLKYEQITEKVRSSSSGSLIIPTREPTNNQNQWQTRFAKLDFPKFFDEDLEAWVYKCEKFFEFNAIDETQKVRLASIHMEDRAIHWFRWYEKTHILRTWREFAGALIARFGDSLFDDAVRQLTKLRQISTVKTYQEKFEELANKTNGLSEEFFVSCFVSGLKDEIKAGVQMFRPKNVSQAMGLARLQEETIEALAKKNRVFSKSYNSSLPTSSKSMELAPKPMESATAVKKMTQKELEERRMKGLCYGCDEKYFRGHVCKKKQLFMIEAEEEEDVFEDVVQEIEKEDVQEELQISVHALSGSLSYKTMRIKEKVKKNVVTILIDSGSTHNFLDPTMAKRTGASIQFTNPLAVVVADGTKLQSKAVVKDFQWVMQGTNFTADMRLLPLGGCDMVLGVQWLPTLGPVLWDFQNLRMEFTAFGTKHVLRGGATVEIQQVEVKAMNKLMSGKSNQAADALSRKGEEDELLLRDHMGSLSALSVVICNWVKDLQTSWVQDSNIQQLIAELIQNPASHPHFLWQNQMLYYKTRLVVGNSPQLKATLIKEHHATPTGGHSGGERTYRRIKQGFYWKGLKSDVLKFVAECDIWDTAMAAADTMRRDKDAILKLLKEHLVQSQHRMKQQADKHRSERVFTVGDWVYLKLQPFKQVSLALRKNVKLAPKYFGPFQILQKLRPVAYKLDLPSSLRLHPVFHVSLLKPKLGQGTVVQPSLPPTSPDGQLQLEPIAILDRKLIKEHDKPFTMV